jgi:predicted N-acetyltransferase YhbS
MQDLASRIWRPGARWHIGDLAWGRFHHLGREPEWSTHLWTDIDEPVAWAWITEPGHLDLLVDPAHADVVPEILAWFELAWFEIETKDRPGGLVVSVSDMDSALIAGLVAAGYGPGPPDEPYLVRLCHKLDGLPSPRLPAGYRLDHVTEATLAERVATHRSAFHPSRVVVESYRQVRACWPYRDDLDVVVLDPTGTVVASCLAWYDPGARAGLLEPVATRPEHRRQGLAGAACLEALRRLRTAGATVATIGARGDDAYPEPLRVYQRIGFRPVGRDLTYVK